MIPISNTSPTRYPPVGIWALILINCVVFLLESNLPPDQLEEFIARYALVPARYFSPRSQFNPRGPSDYLPFLTSMFLHGGWLHLVFNMWTLWLFGPAVENRQGTARFLVFYIACGLFASCVHAAFYPLSQVPILGASGAISGVLACFLLLYPWARLIVLVPILFLPFFFELPAVIFISLWFLIQLLQGTASLMAADLGGGIAWWAHIGGFLAGLVLGPLLVKSPHRFRPYYDDEGVLGFKPTGSR